MASTPPSNARRLSPPQPPFLSPPLQGSSPAASGRRRWRLRARAPLRGFGDANAPWRLTSGAWGCDAPAMALCQTHWPSVVINQPGLGERERKQGAQRSPGPRAPAVPAAAAAEEVTAVATRD